MFSRPGMNIHPPGDEHAPVRVWRHIRGGKAFHPSGPDPLPARGQPSTHPGEIPRTTGRGPAPARVIRPTRAGADRHPLGCMDLPGPVQQHIRSGLEHPPSGCKAASAPTSGYFLSYRRHGSLNGFRALARRHLQGHSASGPGLAACGGCGSWLLAFGVQPGLAQAMWGLRWMRHSSLLVGWPSGELRHACGPACRRHVEAIGLYFRVVPVGEHNGRKHAQLRAHATWAVKSFPSTPSLR